MGRNLSTRDTAARSDTIVPNIDMAPWTGVLMANTNHTNGGRFQQNWTQTFAQINFESRTPSLSYCLMSSLLSNADGPPRNSYGNALLVVGPSSIEGAGEGLFAAVNIKKGEVVVCMEAPVIVESVDAVVDRGFPHDSVIHSQRCRAIIFDATFDSGIVPKWYKLNHSKRRVNLLMVSGRRRVPSPVKAVYCPEWHAKRNIDAGEELFFDYGVTPPEWQ